MAKNQKTRDEQLNSLIDKLVEYCFKKKYPYIAIFCQDDNLQTEVMCYPEDFNFLVKTIIDDFNEKMKEKKH